MTGPLEAAAVKVAAPVAKESWKQGQRFLQRLRADHGPVHQCPNLQRNHGDRVVMLVGVAPSDSPKHVPTADFIQAAHNLAAVIFTETAARTEWSSKERVRFKVRDSDDPGRSDQHILEIFPSGFMLLQWGLDVETSEGGVGPFPVGEFIRVLRHLHSITRLPVYQQLHAKRPAERRRRLDWRVSATQGLATGKGTFYISEFDTPHAADFKRAERHDLVVYPGGFAPQQLTGVKPNAPFVAMLRAIIEDMTGNAGFIDPREATEVIMADHATDWSPV